MNMENLLEIEKSLHWNFCLEESFEYNIGQLFYEYFLVNFPKRVIHKENQCNSKQIKLMKEYSQKQISKEEDPRWNILKGLKNEN